MRPLIGLILGLLLALGVSVSGGEWRMQIHRGGTVEEFPVAEIDSVTFREVSEAMVWIPAGNVRMGQAGLAEPVHDFYVDGFWIDVREVSNAEYREFIDAGSTQGSASTTCWAVHSAVG